MVDKPLSVPGVTIVDLSQRSWDPNYAIRPAIVFVFHVMQGFRNWIGTTAPGPKGPSSHFTAHQLLGELQQHIPFNRVAKTNGGLVTPSLALTSEFPSHWSKSLSRRITDANRPTITMESGGFSQVPPRYDKEKWLSMPDSRYYVYGPPGNTDRHGRLCKEWSPETIQAMKDACKATFDLGWMRDDPSEANITGHYTLNTASRANDPGVYWVAEHLPEIIQYVRPNQAKLPNPGAIERATPRTEEDLTKEFLLLTAEIHTLKSTVASHQQQLETQRAWRSQVERRMKEATVKI